MVSSDGVRKGASGCYVIESCLQLPLYAERQKLDVAAASTSGHSSCLRLVQRDQEHSAIQQHCAESEKPNSPVLFRHSALAFVVLRGELVRSDLEAITKLYMHK